MDKDKVKLIIQNMELLLRALKEEIQTPSSVYNESLIDDYDEVFED